MKIGTGPNFSTGSLLSTARPITHLRQTINPFLPKGAFRGRLSLAIDISPNNGAINMIQSDKLVVNVLTMH